MKKKNWIELLHVQNLILKHLWLLFSFFSYLFCFKNFDMIYLRMGFPRLTLAKQAELAPQLMKCIQDKPQPQQDWWVINIFWFKMSNSYSSPLPQVAMKQWFSLITLFSLTPDWVWSIFSILFSINFLGTSKNNLFNSQSFIV